MIGLRIKNGIRENRLRVLILNVLIWVEGHYNRIVKRKMKFGVKKELRFEEMKNFPKK